MAIPVQFQQFKSAGIYRLVYDKSTIAGVESELLRLVVGYSPKGPFNTPVYVKSVSDFKAMFGDISKSLEKRGCFFHRTCIHALEVGPILCLNLKKFEDETTKRLSFADNVVSDDIDVIKLFDTSRFWKLEPENISEGSSVLSIAAIDSADLSNTVVIRKTPTKLVKQYNITVADWYKMYSSDMPDYFAGLESKNISDFFVDVYVFKGQFTSTQVAASKALENYFNISYVAIDGKTALVKAADGNYYEADKVEGTTPIEGAEPVNELDYRLIDGNAYLKSDTKVDENATPTIKKTIKNAFNDDVDCLDALAGDSASGLINRYTGCIIPEFVDPNTGYKSIDVLFNIDSDYHNMMMDINNTLINDEGMSAVLDCVVFNDVTEYTPYFVKGYTFKSAKPVSNKTSDKLNWQNKMLDMLIDSNSGIKGALLSTTEIDYRYIIDSFESYYSYGKELKSQISIIAKAKELCFAILNYPSVKSLIENNTLCKINSPQIIDFEKVTNSVLLPSEGNGASFCAFYTPLKFTDGYIDTIVPSAGLVSNLFFMKHKIRHPYSIVAGPNYSNIVYNQLVGPEFAFSQSDLDELEPYGVNCMIYRPTFGTFINANQTAKQFPKSALSAVNVRELVIHLQDEIGKILQSYQWEFNNQNTRDAIKSKADFVCESARQNGGIQAYLNVMDDSNNTPDIIDNEMCVISTSIEPGRGMGKMIHELTIYRTGGMSANIKE